MSQGDLLLTITNVRGESADKELPDSIMVAGWTFSANAMSDPNMPTQQISRVKLGDLVITKAVDTSSPILLNFLVTNQLIDEVKLFNRKAGGKQEGFYRIELKGARIRSVAQKGISIGGSTLEEVVSFAYKTITCVHSEQGSRGNLLGGGNTFTYDWESNR